MSDARRRVVRTPLTAPWAVVACGRLPKAGFASSRLPERLTIHVSFPGCGYILAAGGRS